MGAKALTDATPQEIGEELNRRGLDYVLLVNEKKGFHAYVATQIREQSNNEAGGIYTIVRDYLNFLELKGVTEWVDE